MQRSTLNPAAFPMSFNGLEFATFRLKPGVLEAAMLAAAKKMEDEFLSKEEGFLGHAVLKGRDGTYVDLAFATTQARVEEICSQWTHNAHALAFLEFVEPTSANMSFWARLQ